MPRLSDEQYDERRRGLGASDVAVLAGVSPYRTPMDLYLEKIGELDPIARESDAGRARMERGHRLEDVALEWDADIHGEPFERVRRTIWHPRLPFLFAHPDARRRPWSKTRTLIEAKTSNRQRDGLPRDWEAQVMAQMAVTGAQRVQIVVLGFDGPPERIEIERNDELIEALEGLASEFWDRVQRRDPPPMDGSPAVSRWLDRMWRDVPEIAADQDQARVLGRILAIDDESDRLDAERHELVNVLKFSMAGGARLYARGVGSVLWTAPSDRRTVAWKDVAAALRTEIREWDDFIRSAGGTPRTDEALDGIVERHTKVEEGIRQFRVSPPNTKREAA